MDEWGPEPLTNAQTTFARARNFLLAPSLSLFQRPRRRTNPEPFDMTTTPQEAHIYRSLTLIASLAGSTVLAA